MLSLHLQLSNLPLRFLDIVYAERSPRSRVPGRLGLHFLTQQHHTLGAHRDVGRHPPCHNPQPKCDHSLRRRPGVALLREDQVHHTHPRNFAAATLRVKLGEPDQSELQAGDAERLRGR